MRTLIASAWVIVLCCALASSGPVQAASPAPKATAAATPSPPLSASEKQFVDVVTADLQDRFGTTAQAAAAGYFRYTDEDETGAISWVNPNYWKGDAKHPSQLWYDVHGKLIGVDISLPKTASPPQLWSISPSRWINFEQHVHFGVKTPAGIKFGATGPKGIAKVGGSTSHPTAADVVKLGKAKSVDDVAFVFEFPAIWDLEFWLVPNPLGPFAEHNPNVHPSTATKSGM